uniref:PHB domain-containing protein n=1 Tax=Strongyloides papillosus TaxID=174720 RepID=A0A0N5CAY1_STREA
MTAINNNVRNSIVSINSSNAIITSIPLSTNEMLSKSSSKASLKQLGNQVYNRPISEMSNSVTYTGHDHDEGTLSDSSNDLEAAALETLQHVHEEDKVLKSIPGLDTSSILSSWDGGNRSDNKVIPKECDDDKNNKDNPNPNDIINYDRDKNKENGGLNIYDIRKEYDIQRDDGDNEANIQNEFGICGWILTILSYILIFLTLPISACMCIKVVQEYERAVIFRLGRLMPGGAKGPGIFFIVPCIDTYRKVDLRVLSFEVPPQEILSKDSVTVAVDAVVYFRISNATISVTNVEDCSRSTKLLAQTTLRNILGTKTLAEMLSDREAISLQMQSTLDEATEPWGVKVERVEVKDVRLPVQLQRAMAAEAEAAREARAKVIVAEGEKKASRALKEAAEVIAESPSALQLRYLQTLNSISAEKNSTIIFPFPIDLLSSFLTKPTPKPTQSTSTKRHQLEESA